MREDVPTADGESSNAISLFAQTANANDFPVLKAFQEYIDAEQSKARKRMLGLSIFFVVLLVLVVITFTVIIISIFTHNRELSDRLLDVAFRERLQQSSAQSVPATPQPIVQPVVTPVVAPSQDSGIKPILEKLDALATALVTRQQQTVQQPPPVVVTTAPAPVTPLTSQTESADTLQMKETIKKQQAELEAERNRLRDVTEKLHQAEIERHRRRLYPEYYAQTDAADRHEAEEASRSQVGIAREPVAPSRKLVPLKLQPEESAKVNERSNAPLPVSRQATSLKDIKPINYFTQGDLDEQQLSRPNKLVQQVGSIPQAKSVQQVTPDSTRPATSSTKTKKTPQVKAKPHEEVSSKHKQPAKNAKSLSGNHPLQPLPKTETLDVGTSTENQIPWLIESRDL